MRIAAVLMMVFCLPWGNSWADSPQAWPVVELPANAKRIDLGPQMTINGLPIRAQGFVAAGTTEEVRRWFYQSLGQPLVETRRADKIILGRREDEYFLTVELQDFPNLESPQTQGIVAVSHLRSAVQQDQNWQREHAQWMQRLPTGTRITSLMQADDEGRLSTHLVAQNQQSEQTNAHYLIEALARQGYALERRMTANDVRQSQASGMTLLFRGARKEGVAVLSRDPSGRSAIVLSTVTYPERYQK